MTQTIEQLEFKRAKLLKENPNLVSFQNQIEAILADETQIEKCTMLINLCHQHTRLLNDSMKLIADDIKELEALCSEFRSDYLK